MLLSLTTLLPILKSEQRVTSWSMVLAGVLSQNPNSILLRHNLSGIEDVMKIEQQNFNGKNLMTKSLRQ